MLDTAVEMEHRIRQRAYYIWQHEGCPEGRADEHWSRAREAELGICGRLRPDDGTDAYQEAIRSADNARRLYEILVEASGDIALSDDEFGTLIGLVQNRADNHRKSYQWISIPAVSPLYVDHAGLPVVFHKDEEDEVYLRLVCVKDGFRFLDNPTSPTMAINASA